MTHDPSLCLGRLALLSTTTPWTPPSGYGSCTQNLLVLKVEGAKVQLSGASKSRHISTTLLRNPQPRYREGHHLMGWISRWPWVKVPLRA